MVSSWRSSLLYIWFQQYLSVCGPGNSRFLALKFRLLKFTLSVLFPHQIATAVKFLQNSRVRQSPLATRRAFLKKKGTGFLGSVERQWPVDRAGVWQLRITAGDRRRAHQGSPTAVHVCGWDTGMRWPPSMGCTFLYSQWSREITGFEQVSSRYETKSIMVQSALSSRIGPLNKPGGLLLLGQSASDLTTKDLLGLGEVSCFGKEPQRSKRPRKWGE